MRKLVAVLTLGAVTVGAMIGHAQSRRPELFTSYVSGLAFQVHIPAATCTAIIRQADRLVSAADGLRMLDRHDVQTASLNLRSCATSPETDLARIDRDLAVGLYGEVVAEIERRDREQK